MIPSQFFVVLAALGLSAMAHGAPAVLADHTTGQCGALSRADFSALEEAPTQITEATWVQLGKDHAGYCQVSGTITPSVRFILRLPAAEWNGKFIELGCGGLCGHSSHIAGCEEPLRRGYACIVTDGGHDSGDAVRTRGSWRAGAHTSSGALWAYNNWQALIDYFARANHVTALAGKAIVERYYDQAPARSYFTGCSAGGREAMMMAQRYPQDFDGIIAGDPSLNQMGIRLNMLWGYRAFIGNTGKPLLSQNDLELVHQGVLAQCDLNDGIQDGLIGDPRACAFDPAKLQCAAGQSSGCLTARQIEAVQKLYNGPMTSRAEPIYMPGAMKGSERSWMGFASADFAQDAFRYYMFQPSPGAAWKAEEFDFDRDPQRLNLMEGLFAAVNPDLRSFKSAGGKLLVYADWNDHVGMPLHAVDYYETVERTMGGRAATQEFFRLFAIPGLGHCDGGSVVDWLSVLEAWVERGQAPQKLIGTHVNGNKQAAFTRPIYPYPTRAKYLGRGDPKQAASFGASEP